MLFTSPRNSYSRFSELFTVSADEGGLEEKIALPMGFEAAFSPDDSQIAYVPVARAFNAWKRYRGGLATPVWIANLATGHIQKIPRDTSNDFNPMWIGDKVYFLSDRNGPVTLFCYAMLAPVLALFAYVRVYPIAWSVVLSFYRWDMIRPRKPFVGLDNYLALFADENFLLAVG